MRNVSYARPLQAIYIKIMEPQFKYDVAFSFCQEDEQLAYEIADQLSDSIESFIYSKKQNELVGKDGEIEFKKTFSENARVVVVLYREKYGTTPWTRIEEDAIRGRAYNSGYDFTLFISLDKNIPIYLPKTRIWYNIERFGTKGAATVISSLINEQGGEIKEISAKEKAGKLQRKLEFKSKVEAYRQSHEAIGNALKEVDRLFEVGETKVKETFNGLNYGFNMEPREYFRVVYQNFVLVVQWSRSFNNSLDKSGLKISFLENPSNQYKLKQYEYDFDKNVNWENVWRLRNNDNELFKTEYLVEKHLKELMDFIERKNFKNDEDGPQLFFI